jgi:hypothetical protein
VCQASVPGCPGLQRRAHCPVQTSIFRGFHGQLGYVIAQPVKPESIEHLVRLHEFTVADARRSLAGCVGNQAAAHKTLTEAVRSIARETERVKTSSCDDLEVEAFAAWLGRSRAAVEQAEARLRDTAADTAIARAALHLAENAAVAAETLTAQRQRAERNCGSP